MIQVRNIAHIFLFLGVFAIPFEFLFFRPYTEMLRFIWQPLTNGIAQFLGLELKLHDLSSDSLGLYILLILIFLVASTFVLIFQQKRWFDRLVAIAKLISACYLGMVLIRYGLDKVLMIQFPKPGPNLLFTPFGMQDRDILFWSVMGLSPTYMITTGLIEVIAGVLLLFTRTRAIGGLLGLAIMSHVFLLNISFDISVKLFSLFLLLQALAASFPLLITIFYNGKKNISADPFTIPSLRSRRIITLVFGIIITTESGALLIKNSNNDAPFEMQAYALLDPQEDDPRVLYIHEDGYLILQDKSYQNVVYPILKQSGDYLLVEIENKPVELLLRSNAKGGLLSFSGKLNDAIGIQRVEFDNLPALQNNFHLTVDELVLQ